MNYYIENKENATFRSIHNNKIATFGSVTVAEFATFYFTTLFGATTPFTETSG